MGREAVCLCEWGGESAECKVLLEPDVLIARGGLVRKAAMASIQEARVDGDRLRFRVGGDAVALRLGEKQARSWLKKLTAPPVTLAAKLGFAPGVKILLLGEVESEALREALAGTVAEKKAPEMVVLCAELPAELERDLRRATAFGEPLPVWVVYRKGARSEVGEGVVRERMRDMGWVDIKVAAVDGVYTALKFVLKKP